MNIGIIGTGTRSVLYLNQILGGVRENTTVKALTDTDEEKLKKYAKEYFSDENMPSLYTDFNDMMANEELDMVFICTPDSKHTDIVLPILRMNKNILLEKPMATTIEDCKAIYSESLKHDKYFYLGFVLRYTPLYRKVKEIIDSGVLGDIIAVEAKEMLEYLHGASYMRRWHRFRKNSGGFLNTKCCHDMDLLNWLIGSDPEFISAFGSRSYFNPKKEAAMRCPECNLKDTCRYFFKSEDYLEYNCVEDLCVYNSEKDIYDNEIVNIQYENGVKASFTVTMLSDTETRTLIVFGSDATLYADLTKNIIEVKGIHPNNTKVYNITVGQEAHSGGDAGILETMFDAINNHKGKAFNDARAGLLSSAMTLAAEKSINEKTIVNIKEFIGL
jgi:predicted dehydrogenase